MYSMQTTKMKVKISPLNHDPANLDGDGQFDGIDIAILEEDENKNSKQTRGQSSGCFVPLIVGGIFTVGFTVTKLIV